MNEQQWFYESNGQQGGPVKWDNLMSDLKAGSVTQETLVWAGHLPEWTPLGQCIVEAPQAKLSAVISSSEATPRPDQPTTLTATPTRKASAASKPRRHLTLLAVVLAVPLLGIVTAIVVPAILGQRERARQLQVSNSNGNAGGTSTQDQGEPNEGMSIDEAKRILTSDDLFRDQIDLSAHGFNDIGNIIGAGIVRGQTPATPPQAQDAAVRAIKGFVRRVQAEQYLSMNDPNFSRYAVHLNNPAQLGEVASLIDKFNFGSYLANQKQYTPSELAMSKEAAQNCINQGRENSQLIMNFYKSLPIISRYIGLSSHHDPNDLSGADATTSALAP